MLSIHLHSHKLITRRSITRNFRVHSIQLEPNTSTKYSAVIDGASNKKEIQLSKYM